MTGRPNPRGWTPKAAVAGWAISLAARLVAAAAILAALPGGSSGAAQPVRPFSLADAVADLGGRPEEINRAFAGFQKYLYQQAVLA